MKTSQAISVTSADTYKQMEPYFLTKQKISCQTKIAQVLMIHRASNMPGHTIHFSDARGFVHTISLVCSRACVNSPHSQVKYWLWVGNKLIFSAKITT